MEDPITLSDRLYERLTGSDNPAGQDAPAAADDTAPGLEQLMHDLRDPEWVDSQLRIIGSFDVDAAWRTVSDAAGLRAGVPAPDRHPRRHRLVKWLRRFSVAALIALIAGLAAHVTRPDSKITPPVISHEIALAIAKSEHTGLSKAVIEKKNYAVTTRVTTRPAVDKPIPAEAIEARPDEDKVVAEMLSATKVTTYHDKEYWLTLPDGTLVHLAGNTRIIYPDRFTGDSRDVYLEGEAYFIVAKSFTSRFVVHTKVGTTTVYGTEFNVCARTPSQCDVVLVQGSVSVATLAGSELRLTPGQEAVMDRGSITVTDVDVTPYTAWNAGRIDFTDWPLARVMSVIGRWYGCAVSYDADTLGDIRISGSFDRYESLLPTLDAISTITGLTITARPDTIRVSM